MSKAFEGSHILNPRDDRPTSPGPTPFELEQQRARLIAQCDLILDVYPDLMRALASRVAHARMVAAEMGVSADDWERMGLEDREQLLRRHRDMAKRDMGVSLRQWRAMDMDERYELIDRWRAQRQAGVTEVSDD